MASSSFAPANVTMTTILGKASNYKSTNVSGFKRLELGVCALSDFMFYGYRKYYIIMEIRRLTIYRFTCTCD